MNQVLAVLMTLAQVLVKQTVMGYDAVMLFLHLHQILAMSGIGDFLRVVLFIKAGVRALRYVDVRAAVSHIISCLFRSQVQCVDGVGALLREFCKAWLRSAGASLSVRVLKQTAEKENRVDTEPLKPGRRYFLLAVLT